MNWAKSISQHDLVYLSPPEDPMQGIPIGNGSLGALLWTEKDKLIISLNHSELWDEAPQPNYVNKDKVEAKGMMPTTCRHAGRLIMDFAQPIFDCWYLQDCRGGLTLDDATAHLSVSTPFAQADISAYASQDHQVLVLKGTTKSDEAIERKLTLERWGTRTFARWYSHASRDPSIGLDGTQAGKNDQRIFINQRTRSGRFCVGAALIVEDGASFQTSSTHKRAAEFTTHPSHDLSWTLYLTIAVSEDKEPEPSDPYDLVMKALDQAISLGEAQIHRQHAARWHDFWSASGVYISNTYLENLWYLHFYLMASCSQGQSPPHFINGLWGWNRDIRPWNDYFHWNMQTLYWSVDAANHGELARPYQEFRRRQLPFAIQDASSLFGQPGAFYSDISERRGYQDPDLHHNLTPGSQIALEFWRHYQFSEDEHFLAEQAYPVLRETSRFFVAMLSKGPDGLYHMNSATAYEGWILLRDGITDLATGEALLKATIESARRLDTDHQESAQWAEVLSHLAPFPVMTIPADWGAEQNGALEFRVGVSKGQPILHAEMLAAGTRVEDGEVVCSRLASGVVYDGLFPEAEYAPVFPAEILGLKEKGSPLFEAAVNCVRLNVHQAPGWVPGPIVLARLGLTRELAQVLEEWPSRFQFHNQGFFHWIEFMRVDADQRWRLNMVRDVDSGDEPADMTVFPMESWPSRHMAMESSGTLAAGINEMLLQSHEGIIRVFPATSPDIEAGFTLLARGGFLISAWKNDGQVQWIEAESRLGKCLTLENPWSDTQRVFIWSKAPGEEFSIEPDQSLTGESIITQETQPGHAYFLSTHLGAPSKETARPPSVGRNACPKKLGTAVLGKERLF